MPVRENSLGDQFPVGMRVLAIDANFVCLKYLVTLLQQCRYKVTATTDAEEALQILRDNNEEFDIVITDVVRQDIDGFKLLQIIGLEMDIPVVMVSANDDVANIMRSIKHGARDYLLKPVRLQEMMNIWQHVIRKNNITKEVTDKKKLSQKRSRDQPRKEEDETNTQSEIVSSTRKKSRLSWTPQLHLKFLNAIQELGDDEAVPNNILKIMNVPRLTRENVASHLQKYRNILKKQKATVTQQKNGEHDLNIGCGNSVNTNSYYTTYPTTSAEVPGNIHPGNLVANSEPLSSSLMDVNKPKQLDMFQYYMQSVQDQMQPGMHNHVSGNPPSTPLPTENYNIPAVPDFKLLKFPNFVPGIEVLDGCMGISQPFSNSICGQAGPSNRPPFSSSILDQAVCFTPPPQMLEDASTQIGAISQQALAAWPPQNFLPGQHVGMNFINSGETRETNHGGNNIDYPDYMQDPNLTDLKGKGKAKAVQYFPEHPHMDSGFHQYNNSFMDDDLTVMVKEFNDDGPPNL